MTTEPPLPRRADLAGLAAEFRRVRAERARRAMTGQQAVTDVADAMLLTRER